MAQTSKICSLSDAIRLISHCDSIAIGGANGHDHPMAAVREIIRQRRRELHISGYSKSVAIDLLTAAGCASVVESNAGSRLRAASLGLRMLPLVGGVDGGRLPPEAGTQQFVDP